MSIPEWLDQLHFLRPWWLLALLPLTGLLWLLYRQRSGGNAWQGICDEYLLAQLLIHYRSSERTLPLLLLALGWLITVIALAGPTWEYQQQAVFQSLHTRMIVLDLSRSMDSTDLKPSRLQQARFKVQELLRRSEDGQVGLVVFAADAFVVVPLTQDTATISALLPALETDIMPAGGSRIDRGLYKALQLLQQANNGVQSQSARVILITDAEPDQRSHQAARELQNAGYPLTVLGVGTPQGAPIPIGEGRLLQDKQGNIVIPQLNKRALQTLAQTGGGRYRSLSADNSDLDVLLDVNLGLLQDAEATGQQAEQWQEQGHWLVLLLLPLAALGFRRGWLALLLVALLPPPSHSFDWRDLWARTDQQAYQALLNGNLEQARQLSQNPWQRGAAAYRTGDFAGAEQAFSNVPGAVGHYNRGNALAQQRRYQDALNAYDAALAQNPNLEDAIANRIMVQQLLNQQQQQPDQANDDDEPSSERRDSESEPKQNQQQTQGNRSEEQSQDSNSTRLDEQGGDQGDPDPSSVNKAEKGEQQQGATEEDQQQEPQETKPQDPTDSDEQMLDPTDSDEQMLDLEQQQALEQWLRRIPDDPRGLLRRKFLHQYKRRAATDEPEKQTW